MTTTRPIHFLSMNTMGAPLKPKVRDRYHALTERLKQWRGTKDCAVVFLQETFSKRHVDATFATRLAHEFPHQFFHFDAGRGLRFVASGLGILSTHPLDDFNFTAFTRATGPDLFSNKGVLSARLQFDGTSLCLANCHTQASYINVHQPHPVRIHQLGELVACLKRLVRDDESFMLSGDLNFHEEQFEYQHLLQGLAAELNHQIEDVVRVLFPDKKNHPMHSFAWKDAKRARRIDHLISGTPQNTRLTWDHVTYDDWGLSDHKILQGALKLTLS